MAMPALKIQPEKDMEEERVARLEVHLDHIRSDVADLRLDVRRLDGRIDGVRVELNARIDGVRDELGRKIDGVKDELGKRMDGMSADFANRLDGQRDELHAFAIKTTENFAQLRADRMKDRIWWLLIAASILGTLLTVMARGFKWI